MELLKFIEIEDYLRRTNRNLCFVFHLKDKRILLSFVLLKVFLPSFLCIYFSIVFVFVFRLLLHTSARLIVIQIEFALLSLASFALL